MDWPRDHLAGFKELGHVTQWLEAELARWPCDAVVAHSMAGLAALDSLAAGRLQANTLILVESFLSPPAPLFRNLLSAGADPALVEETQRMLGRERCHYDDGLLDALKRFQFDFERLRAVPPGRLYAIYGDRGQLDQARVLNELGWPCWALDAIGPRLVAGASHLPMLERPAAFYALVGSLLTPSS